MISIVKQVDGLVLETWKLRVAGLTVMVTEVALMLSQAHRNEQQQKKDGLDHGFAIAANVERDSK